LIKHCGRPEFNVINVFEMAESGVAEPHHIDAAPAPFDAVPTPVPTLPYTKATF
jgi:hypothetical protein